MAMAIIVDQPVNSDELAWVLYNERVFVSEYHLEEESLEYYFIHRIGGGSLCVNCCRLNFIKLYKSLGFRVCLIVFFVQDIIYLISVGLVGDILGIELTHCREPMPARLSLPAGPRLSHRHSHTHSLYCIS